MRTIQGSKIRGLPYLSQKLSHQLHSEERNNSENEFIGVDQVKEYKFQYDPSYELFEKVLESELMSQVSQNIQQNQYKQDPSTKEPNQFKNKIDIVEDNDQEEQVEPKEIIIEIKPRKISKTNSINNSNQQIKNNKDEKKKRNATISAKKIPLIHSRSLSQQFQSYIEELSLYLKQQIHYEHIAEGKLLLDIDRMKSKIKKLNQNLNQFLSKYKIDENINSPQKDKSTIQKFSNLRVGLVDIQDLQSSHQRNIEILQEQSKDIFKLKSAIQKIEHFSSTYPIQKQIEKTTIMIETVKKQTKQITIQIQKDQKYNISQLEETDFDKKYKKTKHLLDWTRDQIKNFEKKQENCQLREHQYKEKETKINLKYAEYVEIAQRENLEVSSNQRGIDLRKLYDYFTNKHRDTQKLLVLSMNKLQKIEQKLRKEVNNLRKQLQKNKKLVDQINQKNTEINNLYNQVATNNKNISKEQLNKLNKKYHDRSQSNSKQLKKRIITNIQDVPSNHKTNEKMNTLPDLQRNDTTFITEGYHQSHCSIPMNNRGLVSVDKVKPKYQSQKKGFDKSNTQMNISRLKTIDKQSSRSIMKEDLSYSPQRKEEVSSRNIKILQLFPVKITNPNLNRKSYYSKFDKKTYNSNNYSNINTNNNNGDKIAPFFSKHSDD